jgi:NAD(P)-dependent dehydrogenase (short-subunit alcohol dehydrogenase family)
MFKSKVVAITGAGSGIGRALALEFAARGARLALSDINQAALAETLQLQPHGVEVRTYRVDVSTREAVFQFAADVRRDFGSVHFAVNNAGTSILATVEHLSLEEIEKVLAINLWGVIYGTKAFLPLMLTQKEGCIVNVSSVFGLLTVPCQAAYTMSKFAVRALTETLWDELRGTGVRAVLVHPGGINTNIGPNSPKAEREGPMELAAKQAMHGQMTTRPEDCAHEIIRGLESGKKRLLVGNGAKALHRISRLFPDSYGSVLSRKLGK